MRQPNIISLNFQQVIDYCHDRSCDRPSIHSYVDVKQNILPTKTWLERVKAAWLVYTGKADAQMSINLEQDVPIQYWVEPTYPNS